METWQKVLAFVAGLCLVALVGFGIGGFVGPVDSDAGDSHGHAGADGSGDSRPPSNKDDGDMHGEGAGHEPGVAADTSSAESPEGLSASAAGLTMKLLDVTARRHGRYTAGFVIEGAEGPVTAYETVHTKKMHLIAVRRDMRGFQHLHPRLLHDGVWTADLRLAAGTWQLYADFTPVGGSPIVLGVPVTVDEAGGLTDAPASAAATTRMGPLEVRLSGAPVAGEHSMLTFSVSSKGKTIAVQPYLGARGHVVMINEADGRYVHVHPTGDDARQVEFAAEVSEAGSYHVFFEFRVDAVVRTAHFVREIA